MTFPDRLNYWFGGFLVSFLTSLAFFPLSLKVSVLALLASPLPAMALRRCFRARDYRTMRHQYGRFIQDLAINMSDGLSLDHSLIISGQSFIHFYGQRDPTSRRIKKAIQLIQLRQSPDETLSVFKEAFSCPEAETLFVALKQSLLLGQSSQKLLSAGSRMTSELASVLKEVQSMNHKQTTEAGILAIMPIFMMIMMRVSSTDYFAEALSDAKGKFLLVVAFLTTILSASLGLILVSSLGQRKKKPVERTRSIERLEWVYRSSWCQHFGVFYQRILPRGYRNLLIQSLQVLQSSLPRLDRQKLHQSDLTFQAIHFLWKLPLTVIAFCLASLMSVASPLSLYAWLLVPAIIVLHDVSRLIDSHEKAIAIQDDFPLFLNQLIVLIESGLLPLNAMKLIYDHQTVGQAIYDELSYILRTVTSGQTLDITLLQMGHRISKPEIQHALNSLAQLVQSGSDESLSALRLQGQQCWQLSRDLARRDAEKITQRMMIPMICDLIAVLCLSLAPAITQFQAFT